jgi:hypothetical protein
MSRRRHKNRHHRPRSARSFALRAVIFLCKLALLIMVLPFLLALMFVFAFLLPGQASGRVVGSLFDRVLDWLVGPESQEIVVTGKRRRPFLKF